MRFRLFPPFFFLSSGYLSASLHRGTFKTELHTHTFLVTVLSNDALLYFHERIIASRALPRNCSLIRGASEKALRVKFMDTRNRWLYDSIHCSSIDLQRVIMLSVARKLLFFSSLTRVPVFSSFFALTSNRILFLSHLVEIQSHFYKEKFKIQFYTVIWILHYYLNFVIL